MGHYPRMTSLQVDVTALRAAARHLGSSADELAIAHDRASTVLDADVPRLHGIAAAQARDMLQEARAACFLLGENDHRLAEALAYAADHAEHLESILVACLTPSHGSVPDAAPGH
jgi:hypothetical protein